MLDDTGALDEPSVVWAKAEVDAMNQLGRAMNAALGSLAPVAADVSNTLRVLDKAYRNVATMLAR